MRSYGPEMRSRPAPYSRANTTVVLTDTVGEGVNGGPEWDNEPVAFVVALLRVPESWLTLFEDGEGMIWLPKSCESVDELLRRYIIEAEAVTVIRTPAPDPEKQWDDYSPGHKSRDEAIEEAISSIFCVRSKREIPEEDEDVPNPDSVCKRCAGPATLGEL